MILVTGGTGLVGSHLLYYLALENNAIKAIYRTENSLEKVKNVFSYYSDNVDDLFSKIEWVLADITDVPSLENAFTDVIFVYHCAAVVSFDSREYRMMRQVNIDGTANVVNLSIDKKVQKFCFVSSISAVGNSIQNNTVTEENEWDVAGNNSGYSITKYGAEMEVWRASQEGIDVVVVNPGVILGPGFWDVNTGTMFSKVCKGFKYYTEGVTGFVGVNDVAKVMLLLMKSNFKNERYILVSENVSFRDIFNLIAIGFDKKPPSIGVSKLVTSIAWMLDFVISKLTGKTQQLTKEASKSLHGKTYYSSDKLIASTTFEFEPIKKVVNKICGLF
jgi:nucleoside-diphosphate-sugar epimerase